MENNTGGDPADAQAMFQEAIHLHRNGMVEKAMHIYRQIIAINPEDSDTLHMSGIGAFQSNDMTSAQNLLLRAVEIAPGNPAFRNDLANILRSSGQTDRAIHHYKEAIRLKPDYAIALNNLGATMNDILMYNDAEQYLLRAIEIKPDYAEAYYNCGNTYKGLKDIDRAVTCYNQAIKFNHPKAYINLGVILMDMGRQTDAIQCYRQALKALPDNTIAYNNLGTVLTSQGKLKEAIACHRKCLEINPNLHQTRSNLLLALHYTDEISPKELFKEHKKWAAIYALCINSPEYSFKNDRDPEKRLKIGYISPDFKTHPVAHFIEPVIASHNRTAFEVYCYSDAADTDHVTKEIRHLCDRWKDTCCMDDDKVSSIIRSEGIDILVDLAGHTANNRMGVFARRSAPVQVTYLGYPDTSGLQTMDYRITDASADPPGMTDHLHSERLIHMPNGFLCYRPPKDTPGIKPLPAHDPGSITFGCFNNRAKITMEMICIWSHILENVPKSRIFLKFKNRLGQQEKTRITEGFTQNH
ncbi:MAG: tetratricopeptide repeat protein, partial [Thermodesulfobacteriota bacterium]|nr:tetratricopeptide repeat protein [Thermodesulfobacteriota bacterium]